MKKRGKIGNSLGKNKKLLFVILFVVLVVGVVFLINFIVDKTGKEKAVG